MEYHITLIGKFMACLIHHEVHAFNYICDVTSRSYRHVGSPFKRKNSQELCKKFHKNQFIFTENIGNKGDCIHVSHHIHVYMCHKKKQVVKLGSRKSDILSCILVTPLHMDHVKMSRSTKAHDILIT